ncbi:MAG: DUF898 family protein [Bacteroidota bacterium]
MEDFTNESSKNYKLSFHGSGSSYFGVIIVNWLLIVVTLGLYYPWAKAKQLHYLYGSTALNEERFSFHGTGKEMFKGFIKAVIIFAAIYGLLLLFMYLQMPIIGILVFYACILAIIPFAIHGSYRYRMSRTSWRGIRFGYRGDQKELSISFFKWTFFTIISFGLYSSWLSINLRNYLIGNIRLGSLQFKSDGDGGSYFWLNVKGYFLTLFTLGIYMFWWQKDIFAYYIDNLSVHQDDKEIRMTSTATGGDFFGLLVVNMLIIIFTLGIGYAWVVTRTMDFIVSKIELTGDIDLDTINQTEANFTDATGEDVSDVLDLGFIN